MAVLGSITLGLATALLRSSFRRGGGAASTGWPPAARSLWSARCWPASLRGAGVGSIGDFFHTGTWLIAFAGAALALVGSELASNPLGRREITGPRSRPWAGHAGGESEPLHRNW